MQEWIKSTTLKFVILLFLLYLTSLFKLFITEWDLSFSLMVKTFSIPRLLQLGTYLNYLYILTCLIQYVCPFNECYSSLLNGTTMHLKIILKMENAGNWRQEQKQAGRQRWINFIDDVLIALRPYLATCIRPCCFGYMMLSSIALSGLHCVYSKWEISKFFCFSFFLLFNLSTEQLLDSLLSMRLLMSLKSKTDDEAAGLSH